MAKPSISMPDQLLEDFDESVWRAKTEGELPRDLDRSAILRRLMADFIKEHYPEADSLSQANDEADEGNALAAAELYRSTE